MKLSFYSGVMRGVLFATLALALFIPDAMAACSEARVKRLAKQGKTVASIARTCSMDKDEVKEIVDFDEPDSDANEGTPQGGRGLPAGTPLAACACYGGVSPQHREPNQACRSGYARPRACPQICPGGGYAWQGVCG